MTSLIELLHPFDILLMAKHPLRDRQPVREQHHESDAVVVGKGPNPQRFGAIRGVHTVGRRNVRVCRYSLFGGSPRPLHVRLQLVVRLIEHKPSDGALKTLCRMIDKKFIRAGCDAMLDFVDLAKMSGVLEFFRLRDIAVAASDSQ